MLWNEKQRKMWVINLTSVYIRLGVVVFVIELLKMLTKSLIGLLVIIVVANAQADIMQGCIPISSL